VNANAWGVDAHALHEGSSAFANGATTTTTNQIRLGVSTHTVSIPGTLQAAGISNLVVTSGTNLWNGDLSYQPYSVTTLANGNNTAVIFTNVVVSLDGTITAASAICGIQGGRANKVHRIHNNTPYTIILANQSGLDPTAANRLFSPAGVDVPVASLGFAELEYIGGSTNRWKICQVYPESIISTNVSVASINVGPSGATITNVLTATASLDFPSTTASHSDLLIAITSVTTNDTATLGVPFQAVAGGGAFSCFTTNGGVWVRFLNHTAIGINPAEAMFRATVIKTQ
jgi:hypothetical protein